jgi:NADPH:quinone reductase-like Zn-dependent oxidoreductase
MELSMQAVAYRKSLPINDAAALIDVELPDPIAQGRDLLVEVRAVSVNPVDVKIRRNVAPAEGSDKVLGWDAAGIVRAVGPDVTLFKPGDQVWYAGDLTPPVPIARCIWWMNASSATSRSIWISRRPLPCPDGHHGMGAAVRTAASEPRQRPDGSVAAGNRCGRRSRFHPRAAGAPADGLTVIGTASRPETADWVRELGAHHVLDHSKPLQQEIARLGLPPVTYVASLNQTDQHWAAIAELIAPQGKVALIDDPDSLDVRLLKRKAFRCTGNSCSPGRCSRPAT